jgi:small subunit ribosomal protein S16
MDEPKEGATTLKKKAQEKLAAKANPVVVSEPEAIAEVSEVPAEVVQTEAVVETPVAVAEVAEVPAKVVETEVVVETPAEAAAE